MNTDLYDFPMSWSCWRGICQSNGWQVPPPDRPDLPSLEDYRQDFIKWQDKQREMVFGMRPVVKPIRPVPMQAAPSRPQVPQKPIIKKSKGRDVEL